MDKKTFWIGILSLTATVLLLGTYFAAPQQAVATTTIKDRDFSMVTAKSQKGGDSLYVLDNRSGRVAVYYYDASTRSVKVRGACEMAKLFGP